ncbi:MAG: tRNA lysidine(34) synthetase TilS, partial [Alphaproteobacteria bacterium]|nr:tRNA lysidine(34) synthetase TilS [Alphaproteobacteria bacterium]
TALTVDHGLRPAAALEAEQVKTWCAAKNIPHITLSRTTNHEPRATQNYARNLRYDLLNEWCKENGAKNLLLAHHQGDQAETLFFRLARGSGLDGLACMQPVSALSDSVNLVRPLLGVSKSRLVATLAAQNHPWIEDPSNQNSDYTRVRIRAAIAETGQADDICARAAAVASSLQKFRNLLENKLARKLTECVSFTENGAQINSGIFSALEPEYGVRILAHIIQKLGGHEHKPRTEKLARLYHEMTQGAFAHGLQLGGCVFHPPRDGVVHVEFSSNSAS